VEYHNEITTMIGQTISHYRILQKLGEGGMGVVYKAEDTSLERIVAIKTLPRRIAASNEERERFKREAKAAAALNHPNIATIYGIEELEDETFIVMEYIQGKELSQQTGSGPLPVDQAVDLALPIAEGLNAAHRKGIVHRDIKSSNIMMSESGQPKIMDFGLAKVRGAAQVTKEGTTIGTAAYMSPEQARGEEVDHRSDIWSFGVLLYEMIAGTRPFRSDYDQAVVYAILNEDPPALTEVRPEVPAEMEGIVKRCLAKDPDQRYQSIDETIGDLKALRSPASDSTTAKQPVMAGGRKRVPVLLAGLAGLIILVLGALYLFTPSESVTVVQKSVAVLPFENLNRDEESEYFSDGMTEDIITQLSKIGELRVISRTSSMRYKGTDKGLREIGKELGVATLLEGSIRRSGGRVRITSQLVDAETDEHLWAEVYDRDLEDIFEVQSDVAQKIAAALQATLSPVEKARIERQPTSNLSAYDYYLKGRENYRQYRERDNEYAIEYFKKALVLDPDYSLAYAGLGDAYAQRQWRFGYPLAWLDSSIAMSEKALEIDLNSAEAYKALGLAYEYKGWLRQALEMNEKAVALNPSYQDAVANTGWTHWMLGNLNEGYRWMRRSTVLNPADAQHHFGIGTVLNTLGDTARAREYMDKALDMQPDFEYAYWGKVNLFMVQGKHQEAIAESKKLLELAPDGITALNIAGEAHFFAGDFAEAVLYFEKAAVIDRRVFDRLAVCYHRLGREDSARALCEIVEQGVQNQLEQGSEHSFFPYALARVSVVRGEKEQVYRWLQKAIQFGYRWYAYLARDPSFEELREEERFKSLVADLRTRVNEMRKKVEEYDR
jgi:serine/threonine protein kinase/tetratricopeptide (TPR) repeat protein